MNSAESAEPIRLLVSDIDGTLARDDKTLPSANLDAIVALQAAGVATTLISSRPPGGARRCLSFEMQSIPRTEMGTCEIGRREIARM
jgi:ribonucleotide monophosphatase NagD (HAD superfamily)